MILDELKDMAPAIAGLLGMSNVPQTRRMACAIIANALVFHERIAFFMDGQYLGMADGNGRVDRYRIRIACRFQ